MILLAIEVVLIFTFTSSDNFTLSFYNLISFVQTYDPVYNNDPPEHIMQFSYRFNGDGTVWIASYSAKNLGRLLHPDGNTGQDETWNQIHPQRPVLYLNNQ